MHRRLDAEFAGSVISIRPLYQIANDPAKYANDFFDVTVNCNQRSSIAATARHRDGMR